VESVEFQRYAGGQGSTRNFDLCVNLKASAVAGGSKEYIFSGIDRSDYASLYNFLSGKKIPIKNLEGAGIDEPAVRAPVYNENEIYGGPDDDSEAESDDESYGAKDAEKDEQPDSDESDDMDSDELGSEIDDGLDSDLEEARGKGVSKKRKKAKAKDSDDEGKKPAKKKKRKNDPNAPKAAQSAYVSPPYYLPY